MFTEAYRSVRHTPRVTTSHGGRILIAGLGGGDPFRLLLSDPEVVIATDPCAAHRAVFEIRAAALKCLGYREFLQLGRRDRWTRLFPRIQWLLSNGVMGAWDGRVEALLAPVRPSGEEFALMKERAARLTLEKRSLMDLLAALPMGFADAVTRGAECGSDPTRLRVEIRRVLRRIPTSRRDDVLEKTSMERSAVWMRPALPS